MESPICIVCRRPYDEKTGEVPEKFKEVRIYVAKKWDTCKDCQKERDAWPER